MPVISYAVEFYRLFLYKNRSLILLNLTFVQVPLYWQERNPSTFNEDATNMDGGSGLNTNETELADRARLDVCIQQLLREAREKPKGWVVCSTSDHVDVAFKKVSVDGKS